MTGYSEQTDLLRFIRELAKVQNVDRGFDMSKTNERLYAYFQSFEDW